MDTILNRPPLELGFWCRQRVLLTGHSGFIGGWMATMLTRLGASVHGYALAPQTQPALFDKLDLSHHMDSRFGDINNATVTLQATKACQPTIVLHLASEAIVRRAHRLPAHTFATNIMGTLNVLEACRALSSPPHIIAFTTDKVYENNETGADFRESDALGGKGIYDCSKSAQDQLIHSYRYSYLRDSGVATIRAGNVIGGGDFSEDRIIPDAVRSIFSGNELIIRNPSAVRPWQHVIEVVYATLLLAQNIAMQPATFSGAWNIGPDTDDCISVSALLTMLYEAMNADSAAIRIEPSAIPESQLLRLNTGKAREHLKWEPLLTLDQAIALTCDWYRESRTPASMFDFTTTQLLSRIPTR